MHPLVYATFSWTQEAEGKNGEGKDNMDDTKGDKGDGSGSIPMDSV